MKSAIKPNNSEKLAFRSRIPDQKCGIQLIDYLCDRFTYHSRDKWLQNIKEGEVTVNLKKVHYNYKFQKGDELGYVTFKRAEPKVPSNIPILFEDRDLLIVNKPAQIPVHPGGRYLKNTLLTQLKEKKNLDFLILAHRLDRETSGVCVLSKTPLAKEKMYWKFFNYEVRKTYWALCWGELQKKAGSIDIPIGHATQKGKDPLSRIRIKQMPRGYQAKRALTKYRLLSQKQVSNCTPPPWPHVDPENPIVSLVECSPLTGRTNQIRVHMAEIGNGIVGDKLYDPDENIFVEMTNSKPILDGESGTPGPRLSPELQKRMLLHSQGLHAHSLSFRHPRTQKILEVSAPPPKEWRILYNDPRP